MTFTKRQRYYYYRAALKSEFDNGMCGAIMDVIRHKFGPFFFSITRVLAEFPELNKRKPKGRLYGNGYWFIPHEIKERRKILRACIRETAPRKRKKK